MPRILCLTVFSDRPEAASLIGLANEGFEITLMYPPDGPYRELFIDGGVNLIDLEIKHNIDRHAIAAIRAELKRKPYDIVHTFSNRTITNGLLASRGSDVRIIAYRGIVGNVSFLDPMSWLRYLHPRVDHIVCVAEAIRRYFLDMRFLGLRMNPNKPVTIHKGHDLAWYQDSPADLAQFDIPGDAFVVGCVTNDRPRKGLPVLVDAAAMLARESNVYFLLVGHMESSDLKQRIDRSPMKDRFRLAGFRKDAPALMAACDCAVLPALRREGLPKAIIEAMAYATAPIVTDSGGSPELIVDGESGLIVPSGNAAAIAAAIERLTGDRALCKEMGVRAQARIRDHFRVTDTVEKTAALYRSVLNIKGSE